MPNLGSKWIKVFLEGREDKRRKGEGKTDQPAMEIIFNKDSASLKFWSCGCGMFFLNTQPTFSGQDLIAYFYIPRDLIPWTEPPIAAANNASPGWPPPIVKSTILYCCPGTPCQAVGGLGAWEPPPPGSRIISSVSPSLTCLGDSIEMDWEKLASRVAWELSVWEHMRTTRTVTAVTVDIVRMFYAPGLC